MGGNADLGCGDVRRGRRNCRLLPGGEDREIVSTYPVTDTVIVGTVPERYTYIGGSGSDLLGEIRDYEENSDISHEIGK